MVKEQLLSLLSECISSVGMQSSPDGFIKAARALCELAREVNLARAQEFRPDAKLLGEVTRLLYRGADSIREHVERFGLPSDKVSLIREFADHIAERAHDISEEAEAITALTAGRDCQRSTAVSR